MVYFPYLRGKQYELIALREICEFSDDKTILSPIIEPVKKFNTTLSKTLARLKENNINFNFIFNPQEPKGEIQPADYEQYVVEVITVMDDYKNYQPSFLINERVDIPMIIGCIKTHHLKNITLIITQPPINDSEFNHLLECTSIKYILLDDDSSVRRMSRKLRHVCKDLVFLADRFNLKARNVEYENPDDEFYSDDHLFFQEEGFCGFSDYLTIGNSYTDGGFLPYAVAIHLTYFDTQENLRVRHFVSDSNDDNSDVPGKVSEALAKLVAFVREQNMQTRASKEFKRIYDTESYPGLGSIKKLSMLHHIELLYNYLTKPR